MSRDVLRIGMVGAGYMAKMHSLSFRNASALNAGGLPRVELVRLVDKIEASAQEGAARYGWSAAATDWKAVTRAADIDAVIIATPNDSHSEIAIDALENGKHILCEKPLANELASADEMALRARNSSQIAMVNFVYRCWPAVELARRLIASGEIGEVLHFEGRFFQDYASDPDLPFSWRFDKDVAGSGAFGDIGSHISDIALLLVGPISRVSAVTRRIHTTRKDQTGGQRSVSVDDLASTLVEFECGALGTIQASWAAPGHKCDLSFSITGSKGSIVFSWERSNELHLYSTADPQLTGGFRRILMGGMHPGAEPFWYAQAQGIGYAEAFSIVATRFLQAIATNDKTIGPTFEQGLTASRFIDATLRAAESGRWEEVSR